MLVHDLDYSILGFAVDDVATNTTAFPSLFPLDLQAAGEYFWSCLMIVVEREIAD